MLILTDSLKMTFCVAVITVITINQGPCYKNNNIFTHRFSKQLFRWCFCHGGVFIIWSVSRCVMSTQVLEDRLTCSVIPHLSGSPLANGKMHLHSSVKRKLADEKGYVFDKRLRYNVRQNESNCRFRDIVVRKEEGFTHVLLSSQTTDNNALTPEVRMGMYTHSCPHSLHFFLECIKTHI